MNMEFAVPQPSTEVIPVSGSEAVFPVRRIYAIGRNYGDHAAETGLASEGRSVPGVSLKPADSIALDGTVLPFPPATQELEPEIEMVIAIGRAGSNIPVAQSLDHVFGYAVGFDLIRRDIWRDCIANQHSWDLCKSFAGASMVGPIAPASRIGHPSKGAIVSQINGEAAQRGDLSRMIWKPEDIIARLSTYAPLEPGDIIYTGTPKGPRKVSRGAHVEGAIDGIGRMEFRLS